jgi:hypothetical protein
MGALKQRKVHMEMVASALHRMPSCIVAFCHHALFAQERLVGWAEHARHEVAEQFVAVSGARPPSFVPESSLQMSLPFRPRRPGSATAARLHTSPTSTWQGSRPSRGPNPRLRRYPTT